MLSKYSLEELFEERCRLVENLLHINHNLRMVESAIELKQTKDKRQHKLFEDEQ